MIQMLFIPLDCKEIQPVHPKAGQSWLLFGRRATCPRPLRPGAVADSAASFGGPVAEPASSAISAPPFKESYPWPVLWDPVPCPIFPSFSLRHRERVGTVVPRGVSAIEGQVYFWGRPELGTHLSPVSRLGSRWG